MKFILINLFIIIINFSCTKNYQKQIVPAKNVKIQNEKNDIFYGETIYPEQIKASIKHYNNKYNLKIKYSSTKNDFLKILKNNKITKYPYGIFQYNEGHKYGFIFLKYNNQKYCICIDTIPNLSEYTKDLIYEKGNIYIKFNNEKYRVILFGENLQKAMKGCGSFTLVLLKQLLKNNAKFLFDIIELENKYGTEDKTKRDINKKSCIRGVNFNIIKEQPFAPEIYKYAQNIELQKNFDDKKLNNGVKFEKYRQKYTKTKYDDKKNIKQISTKLFDVTQKHKSFSLQVK